MEKYRVAEPSLPELSFAHTIMLLRPSSVVMIVVFGVKETLVPLGFSWYHQVLMGSLAEALSWIVPDEYVMLVGDVIAIVGATRSGCCSLVEMQRYPVLFRLPEVSFA